MTDGGLDRAIARILTRRAIELENMGGVRAPLVKSDIPSLTAVASS